jgi:mRNA-decapping enzyme subunit 2
MMLIFFIALIQVGYDVSQYINEDDTISATINNNDNEQTIKLYIIAGVPEDTVFETQTRKEIR